MDPRTLHKLSTLLGAACPSGNKVKVEKWTSRRELSPAALQQARPWRRAGGAWRSPSPRKRFGEIVRAARLSMSLGCLLFGRGVVPASAKIFSILKARGQTLQMFITAFTS